MPAIRHWEKLFWLGKKSAKRANRTIIYFARSGGKHQTLRDKVVTDIMAWYRFSTKMPCSSSRLCWWETLYKHRRDSCIEQNVWMYPDSESKNNGGGIRCIHEFTLAWEPSWISFDLCRLEKCNNVIKYTIRIRVWHKLKKENCTSNGEGCWIELIQEGELFSYLVNSVQDGNCGELHRILRLLKKNTENRYTSCIAIPILAKVGILRKNSPTT